MTSLYTEDGVNIALGDSASEFAGQICRDSYENSPFVEVRDLSEGNFRGPRGFVLKDLPSDCLLTGGMDGIGTKVVITDAAGKHTLSAEDVIAMTAMDITRFGGLPLIFMNVLDVSSLGVSGSPAFNAALSLYVGLGQVAKNHGYVLLTGETAELGACVGSENPEAQLKYNMAGCMLGVYHPGKMIRGDTLRSGQRVVVFGDSFRSNGISSVRKALALRYGECWWNNPEAEEDIIQCATPSVQYDRMLNTLHGWFSSSLQPLVTMHLVAHLSGGAFKGKFGDVLKKRGVSAELTNLMEPSRIMRQCAQWRGLSSEEFYETWNGGQGALVVVDERDVATVLDFARQYHIAAQVAGEITERRDYTVKLVSRLDGREVVYV